MLGVVDLLRSSRLRDLLHQSFFAPVQSSEVGDEDGALLYFNPARIVHLLKKHICIVLFYKKGGQLGPPA